ncbi:exodeoxyribonuclease VII large subunit [Desulfothermus naphthae]
MGNTFKHKGWLIEFMKFGKKIYTVSELTLSIRTVLEEEFPLIWVKGEVSNLSKPSSGHIYFSLKDSLAIISAVWFKSNQNIGQNLSPESLKNGSQVLCAGRISVYPQRGTYQLIVEFIEEVGIGDLYVELEMLKQKLGKKGYFDESRKRHISKNPQRVGVITAPNGAAIQDFLRVAREMGMPFRVRIYPSTVQGENAPAEIAKMIEIANSEKWAEVLVLIRGGGSFEDIHVFNSETVADAIFKSSIPVVTGIGHEIDYTIADMVADYRCATPTYVAGFLWEPIENYIQMLDSLVLSLFQNINRHLNFRLNRVSGYLEKLNAYSPKRIMKNLEHSLFKVTNDIVSSMSGIIHRKERELIHLIFTLNIRFKDIVERTNRNLKDHTKILIFNASKKLDKLERDIDLLTNKVYLADPTRPLYKGYSMVKRLDGKVVISFKELLVGEQVNILFKDGERLAQIIE